MLDRMIVLSQQQTSKLSFEGKTYVGVEAIVGRLVVSYLPLRPMRGAFCTLTPTGTSR